MRIIVRSQFSRSMLRWDNIAYIIRLSLSGKVRAFSPSSHAADVELFKGLARHTRDGLEPDSNGDPKLDALLPKVLATHRVAALLLQKQVSRGATSAPQKREHDGENAKLREKIRKLEQAASKNASSSSKGPKGGGRGSDGGKTKKGEGKKKSFVPLPQELRGLEPSSGGKRICFSFNMDGCHAGRDCPKGSHICMRCGSSSHGARSKTCPKK